MKKILIALCLGLASARAQQAPHAPDMSQSSAQDRMAGMRMEEQTSQLPSPHQGSGTAWQPASVTGKEWMWMRRGWDLMAHGVIFIDYNQPGGPRGAGKAESVNWGMLMEQHKLGTGTILFRQMFSAESLTSPHPGFPELFQTGENLSWAAASGSSASAQRICGAVGDVLCPTD